MQHFHATDILNALDISSLPQSEQEEILLDIHDLVYEGAMVRILDQMDEHTRTQLDALLEREVPEEDVEAFIISKVPGANAAVTEAIEELRSDILAATGT